MAFITIYVRKTGSDSNNGTSAGSAFLTAQAGFNLAQNESVLYPYNTYTLDFGAGTYSGINLRIDEFNPNAPQPWPSNLQIKGAGASSTFLGGIDGNGDQAGEYNTPLEATYFGPAVGATINITSDKSINLGNITASGSPGGDDNYNYYQNTAGGGGNITLNNCIAGNITAQTGYLVISGALDTNFYQQYAGTQGGSISIYNSQVSVVEVSGLIDTFASASGTIHLSNYSSATQLGANGGTSTFGGPNAYPTNGGSIYLQNYCTAQSAGVSGGDMTSCDPISGANGGIISLTIHSTTTVSTIANGGYGTSPSGCGSCGGSPGQIIVDETSYATGPQAIDPTGQGACGTCDPYIYAGCTDGCSCNYDPGASCSDGSCNGGSCDACGNPCNYHGGCTDPGASCSGWDSCANYDDYSCSYNYGCGCGSSPWSGTLPDPQYVEYGYSYYIGDTMGYRGTFVLNTSGGNIPISKTIISSILGIPVS